MKTLIILFLRFALILLFVAAGAAKFAGVTESVSLFEALGMEPGGRYLVGFLEWMAAFLLLLPFTITTGALLGWGILSGALLAHFTKVGFSGLMMPITVAALIGWLGCALLLFLRRDQVGFIRQMFDCEKEKALTGKSPRDRDVGPQ